MGLSAIKRYTRIYLLMFRFGIISTMAYPANFFAQILVELGYSVVFIIFFKIIFSRITQIAGWTYYEVLALAGLSIVTSELFLGIFLVFNLWDLPKKIKDGQFDQVLLKPIHSLFNCSFSLPYFNGFLATIPGWFLIIYSLLKLHWQLNIIFIVQATLLFIFGLIISYSITVIFSAFTFVLINAESLPQVANKILFYWTDKPHDVFSGYLKTIFFTFLPVVFVNSLPIRALISGVNFWTIILGFVLSVVFLSLAIGIWNRMLRFYSSASS
jgi:ABC-2 type transport system permease protein